MTRVSASVNGTAGSSAMRGGVQLLVAALISMAANYVFLLGAGRLLGSHDYSTLAALVGLLTVVLLPSGALQMAVSREVSRRAAIDDEVEAARFVRAMLALAAKLTLPLLAVSLALVVPVRELLNISETAPVVLAMVCLIGVFVIPIALGALQGEQRFRALAYVSGLPMVIRLVVLAVLAGVGLRLYGALAAVLVATVAALGITLWAIRDRLRVRGSVRDVDLKPFLRYLWPVAVGLFGISVLTNGDILIVKARFSSEDAGVYAAASAFARVAFFLPSTILAVLFPRTAARQARGEQSADILGRALLVTVGFCGLLTAGYALVGGLLVRATFGSEFAGAGSLLVPFCVAMTLFSVVNVLVGYHLSRGESRFAWVVAVGVVAQVGLLTTIPTTLREVLWVDAAVAGALLVAHELVMGSSVPALQAGLGRLGAAEWPSRALAWLSGIRAAVLESVVVVTGYTAVSLAFTWPLMLHLNSRQFGSFPNDGTGTVAWLWELRHEGGYHFLGATHHTLTGAPLGWDQGNALNFQWLWPYFPTYLLAGSVGELAAFNSCILAGFVLSGAAMYLLVRWLGCGRMIAVWAGLAYIVFPWHLQRAVLGNGSFVHVEIFPLVLLAALAWVRRPTPARASLAALAVTGAWLTSGYFGTIALIALAGISAIGLWREGAANGLRAAARNGFVLWAMALVASGVVAVVAIAAGGITGLDLGRSSGEVAYWGAHLRDYLPVPVNSVTGTFAADHIDQRLSTTGYPGAEGPMYPGLLTLVLAGVWLAVAWRRRSVAQWLRVASLALGVVALLAVVFAAPSPMTVLGFHVHPMPSLLIQKVVPAFRVPTRFAVLLLVALVPLAALGLAHVSALLARRLRVSRPAVVATGVVCAAACAVTVVDLAFLPVPTSSVGATPAVYTAVSKLSTGVLAEYPLEINMSPDSESSSYLFWQKAHGRRLLNGAGRATAADSIRRMLVDPRAPGTAPSLALLGVTTIVTRPTTYDWDQASTVPEPAEYGPGYSLAGRFPAGVRAWRVTASPAPALAAYRGIDVQEPLAPARDGFVGYPASGQVVHVDLYARTAGLVRLNLVGDGGGAWRRLELDGARTKRVVSLAGRTAVVVPVAVPRGRSTLTIVWRDRVVTRARNDHGAMLSSVWFTPSVAGDARRALQPHRVGSRPGF